MFRAALGFFLAILTVATAQAQTSQSGRFDSLQHVREVVVTSKLVFREVMPSQKLNGEELERLSSHSVADALRYFSGVQLKDYGGVGGVKTVDVRSMGTNHLAVSYDGIVLGNAQNGQVDLGQFSLDNVDEITLFNGQKSAIFQPASDFASASSVYIRTRAPRFTVGKDTNWKLRAKYGASDLLRLSALYEHRFNEDLSLSANTEVLTASGKYKFRYHRKNLDGTTAWDTTATRQNGDIQAVRAEVNLHGLLTQGAWQVKGYLYNSARGIPGAIVNNVWMRGERQQDLNTFLQAHVQKSVGERFSTQWLAKYAFYRTHYVNRDSTRLPVDNLYRQQEFYLSTANVLELLPGWSASMSYDLRWNKLSADTYNFAWPTRFTHMLSVATAIDYRHLKVQGSIVGILINDKSQTSNLSRLTPALFANLYPLRGKWLSLRAYVKQSFRMPTFNDLYYTDIGNASLLPEKATQYDVGLVIDRHFPSPFTLHLQPFTITHFDLHADLYYNKVRDKIIAYPKGQQFRWTMLNLGEVNIKGFDLTSSVSFAVGRDLVATLRGQYTYQDARDVTDPETPYYRHQIPYIPRHSGSVIMGMDWRRWTLNYSFLYTGERWNEQENIAYNHMQPWYTSDLSVSFQPIGLISPISHIGPKKPKSLMSLRVTAEVNNLFDQQYDVILNYPMPGRNAAIGLDVTF